jgi:2-methylcitrate dehydratase PrpD
MKENITQTLSKYIEKIKYEDLPLNIIDTAKKLFIDFLAVSIAGFHRGPLAKILYEEYKRNSCLPESTIIGNSKHKMSAVEAALINGVSGHSLDLDDGHREAKGHPGVVVIPALLALAERDGSSGKDFILSMVVGYEIFVRLGKIANPSLFNKGFHTTGVCGALAAAAGTAKLLSCNHQQIESCLSIAGTQSSGLLAITHTGQMIKPLNAGKAAQSGLLSTLLTIEGAKGSDNIIECEDGFLQAFAEKTSSIENVAKNMWKDFAINKCYF